MIITDALALFAGVEPFTDLSSWAAWLVFLKAVYGLPLTADETRLFCECTGRTQYAPPAGGWHEVLCVTGRQSGKTRVASLLQVYEALRPGPTDGTDLFCLSIAQDFRASLRTLFAYINALVDGVPVLAASVQARTSETIRLTHGITLASYPCRPPGVRGLRARIGVLDELAHYRNSENLPVDVEMLRAVRPCLAMQPDARLVMLTSPYAQTGAVYELFSRHYGRDSDHACLVWRATAPQMNPCLPPDYVTRMEQDDPEAFRSEVLGEFRAGLSSLLDPDAVDAVVSDHVRERPPATGTRYTAYVDVSGGRADRFALAVAHLGVDAVAVLDCLRTWTPPFNPTDVVREAAAILRGYWCGTVMGDAYGAELVVDLFRQAGITYRPSPWVRSQLYLEALTLINGRKVRLLDRPDLRRELLGLQRRRGASGHDKVDHSPGQHDDVANAACGALVEVARQASADLLVLDLTTGHLTPAKERAAAMRAAALGLPVGDICAGDPLTRRW